MHTQHARTSLDRFFTLQRVRVYGWVFAAFTLLTVLYVLFTSHLTPHGGWLDALGRPVGTDFAGVWSGGVMARTQGAHTAYDFAAHNALQLHIFGAKDFLLGYHYPPVFTLLIAPLSHLPYVWAVVAYQLLGFACYVLAMRRVLAPMPQGLWLSAVVGFPAVWVNLMHAHNGFLTAALLGLGLALLPTRPVRAGLLFGLLCYKPQFGLLIPFALLAAGQWRAFAAAACMVLALVALSVLCFGLEAWQAWWRYSQFSHEAVISGGATGWHKMQTVFAALRLWGASASVAYAVYGGVAALVLGVVLWAWRTPSVPYAIKASLLVLGTLLVAPYAFDYDLMLFAPAIAFLAVYLHQHGHMRHLPTLMALLWLSPFLTRLLAQHAGVPLAVLVAGGGLCLLAVLARQHVRLSTARPVA